MSICTGCSASVSKLGCSIRSLSSEQASAFVVSRMEASLMSCLNIFHEFRPVGVVDARAVREDV